jgi:excisionase family DNA binding protein
MAKEFKAKAGDIELDRITLTRMEACEFLGVSKTTLDRLVAKGELPSMKMGNLRRFSYKALQEYVYERSTNTNRK